MPRRIVFTTALALTVSMAASWRADTSAKEKGDDVVPGVGQVTWGDCADPRLAGRGAQCALLSVPLDYSKPTGAKIQLALSRMRHTVSPSEYQGIMLVNPGGPGGSGLIFAILRDFVPPFFTWGNAWFNAPCVFWPAESGRPVDPRGKKLPPILLLGETLDAATPFTGSLEVRDRFKSASLIATEGGTTHGNSLFGGNACVDDRVAAYLADGSIPDRRNGGSKPDVVCAAAPEPEPLAAAAAARTSQAATVDERQILRSIRPRR